MDERISQFPSWEAENLANRMIMEYTIKQKGKVYIPYDQIRWAVLGKMLKMKRSGKKYFSLPRLIRKTIKEEQAKGVLLPEEWE